MKNLIKLSVIASVVFLFSGCGALLQVKTPKPLKNEILVSKEGADYAFSNRAEFDDKEKSKMKAQLAETLYTAATYGKQQGFKYFAITKKNISNLNGFPINSFENLVRYCNLKGRGHFRSMCWNYNNNSEGIFTLGSVDLRIRYFKKAVPGLFLYNIDDTIEKTQNLF